MGRCYRWMTVAKDEERDAKLAELEELVGDMDGLDRAMAEDLLWSYTQLWHDVHEIQESLDTEGLFIEVEKGGAGNRHVERVKNPAFDMRYKAIAQQADLANKIKRFVASGTKDVDELTEFLAS